MTSFQISFSRSQLVSPVQIAHLIDTDNPSQVEEDLRIIMAKHRNEGSIQHQKQHINSNDINIGAEGKLHSWTVDIKS